MTSKKPLKQNKLLSEICVFIILALYIILSGVVGIGCPIRRMIHMPCPSCGLTRAWRYALHLDFINAFRYHPLFFFIPIYVAILIFKDAKIFQRIPKRVFDIFAIVGITLILAVYIYRIIYGFGPV